MLIVSIYTRNRAIELLCAVLGPILGGLLVAFGPGALAGAILEPATHNARLAVLVMGVITLAWNFALAFLRTHIEMGRIPAWVWGVLFIVLSLFAFR